MNQLKQKREGFTIIEVVLVLAIVGLIMLMIFIAWPALQRSQRDSARKNDVNTVASSIGTYRGNNNGKNPTNFTGLSGYIDNLSQYDVDATHIVVGDGASGGPAAGNFDTMVVRTSAKCGTGSDAVDGSSRQAAIVVRLEANGSSDGVLFCQNA